MNRRRTALSKIPNYVKFTNPLQLFIHVSMKLLIIILCTSAILWCVNAFGCEVDAAMPVPVTSQQTYTDWLQATGRPAYSRYHGYTANYEVYRDYRILSYGTPQMVPNNCYDSIGKQYAIHGFSYDEYTVTNTYYRDDSNVPSSPLGWKNIALGQDAAVSWMRLSSREKEHIKASRLYYSGKDYGGMTFSSLKLTEPKCIVIAVPSWTLGFALHTKHYNSRRQLRYGTLTGDGIGGVIITGTIGPAAPSPGPVFSIPPDRNDVDLSFTVRSSIQSFIGLARSSDIARGGIVLNNIGTESQGAGPWNATQSIRFTRESRTCEKDYSREITIKSTIWVVSASGDLVSNELSYSFTLVEKAKVDIKGVMTMKGAISLFDGQKTIMGYLLEKHATRFLCLEKITLRIDFNCGTVPDHVAFYPLGAQPASVEVTKTSGTTGYAQIIYPMGILPSTISWSNKRIRPPYQCSASAFYGNKRTDFIVSGIEITGDIYDLVYLQSISTK